MTSADGRLAEVGSACDAAPALAEWWRGAVIYQIYPRSFCDTNGDGVGDLDGVIRRLNYVASLGVDAIWLSPFFKSPMADFGYDISDYCDVDPIFGDLSDFDRLVAKAHTLGLKVIIDQVYSHTSDAHRWFAESRQSRVNPKADWYVWADPRPDGSPPNNWQSVFGGPAWTWDSRRSQYYLHNFLSSQPDLNVHRLEVQAALLDVGRFWLDRGVDGFRLDAINFSMHDPELRDNPPAPRDGRKLTRPFDYQLHINNQSHPDIPSFLEKIRQLTDNRGGAFTVAEVGGLDPLAEMKAFTSGSDKLHSAYNFAFLYADRLTAPMTKAAVGAWGSANDEGWPSWAFSNHDAPRAVSRWAKENDRDRCARLYAMALLCLRGNAFIYQGEELGLPQAEVPRHLLKDPEAIANWPLTLGRDGARTPMPWIAAAPHAGFTSGSPWLPIDPRHAACAIDVQENDPQSVLAFVRRMLSLRREFATLRIGDISFIDGAGGLLAFYRRFDGEEILCAFNFDASPHSWRLPGDDRFSRLIEVGCESERGGLPDKLPPNSGYAAIRRR